MDLVVVKSWGVVVEGGVDEKFEACIQKLWDGSERVLEVMGKMTSRSKGRSMKDERERKACDRGWPVAPFDIM